MSRAASGTELGSTPPFFEGFDRAAGALEFALDHAHGGGRRAPQIAQAARDDGDIVVFEEGLKVQPGAGGVGEFERPDAHGNCNLAGESGVDRVDVGGHVTQARIGVPDRDRAGSLMMETVPLLLRSPLTAVSISFQMSISIFEVWTWEVWEEVSPEETVELMLEPLMEEPLVRSLLLLDT